MAKDEGERLFRPEQCRAGRALLNWSQEELAKRARVAKQTLADFERGAWSPYPRTLADIREALEAEGVDTRASAESNA